jgi:hypothetical protein
LNFSETRQGVIPEKAGIQLFQNVLDPGFRRGGNNEQLFKGVNMKIDFQSPRYRRPGQGLRHPPAGHI